MYPHVAKGTAYSNKLPIEREVGFPQWTRNLYINGLQYGYSPAEATPSWLYRGESKKERKCKTQRDD